MSGNQTRYAAVFFDLDGTLVSERVGVREARLAVGRELLQRGLTAVAPEAFVDAVERVTADVLREHDNLWPAWFHTRAWLSRALERIGCPLDDESPAFAELAAVYASERTARATAITGAPEAIGAAREHGPVALITNYTDAGMQRRKIASAGLEGQFDAVVISGEVGYAKPDPKIFHHAARELGVRAHDCVHIGNSWASDIEGALAAGVGAIWVEEDAPAAAVSPDPRVLRLADLAAVTEHLRGARSGPHGPGETG